MIRPQELMFPRLPQFQLSHLRDHHQNLNQETQVRGFLCKLSSLKQLKSKMMATLLAFLVKLSRASGQPRVNF